MHLLAVVLVSLFISIGLGEEVEVVTELPEVKTEEAIKVQYSEVERRALEKFRPLVEEFLVNPEDKESSFLITWLRARNYDVNKAAEMLRSAQKWRLENNLDSIANETIFDFTPPPYEIIGFDFEGHPMAVLTPTIMDIRKLLVQGYGRKLERYLMQTAERLIIKRKEGSKLFGKDITQVTLIADFQGFNLRQHSCIPCLPFFRDMFLIFEKYYPDALKHLVVINLPKVAVPLIDFLKPLLSSSSAKALKVFPANRQLWSEYLFTLAPPDQLPFRFGGTRKS